MWDMKLIYIATIESALPCKLKQLLLLPDTFLLADTSLHKKPVVLAVLALDVISPYF
jgi:hypothetical protein